MIILALLLVALAFYALRHQPKPRRHRHGNAAGDHASLIGGYSGPSWSDGGSHGHHCGSHGGVHGGSCGH